MQNDNLDPPCYVDVHLAKYRAPCYNLFLQKLKIRKKRVCNRDFALCLSVSVRLSLPFPYLFLSNPLSLSLSISPSFPLYHSISPLSLSLPYTYTQTVSTQTVKKNRIGRYYFAFNPSSQNRYCVYQTFIVFYFSNVTSYPPHLMPNIT